MCTAISVTEKEHYFGRNLDYGRTFGEKIIITPKNYIFNFRDGEKIKRHYAIIGIGIIMDNYPLYFDAANESGLCVAGLNFPNTAKYNDNVSGCVNIASFEFVPWILCKCENVSEAKKIIEQVNITDEAYSEKMPVTPLHWMIADKAEAITVEQTKEGIKVYENPVGVLTNNPDFKYHMTKLVDYISVSNSEPVNKFSDKISLIPYSRGMGGLGIPGDLSSSSRFVKACFTKLNSFFGETEQENVIQFFHILNSVFQQKGCVMVGDEYEMTNYTSCCNTNKGIYYYTTYNNQQINAVDMRKENLEREDLITYEFIKHQDINFQN